MRPGLDMSGDDVGARLAESLDKSVHRRDHQMEIHHAFDMRADRRTGCGTKGDVWHEMAVHHIDMNPVGPLRLDGAAPGPEVGKIGGKDRRGDLDGAVEGHSQAPARGGTVLRASRALHAAEMIRSACRYLRYSVSALRGKLSKARASSL